MGIKEIADLAGVSIGTVDRVLHNRGRVSEATRKKIIELVAQHEYQPNLVARSLVNRKKGKIALLVPDPKEDEYWQQAWKGVKASQKKFRHQGIDIESFFYSLSDRESFKRKSVEILNSTPSGLIMAPNYLEEGKWIFDRCTEQSIPVIMFDTLIPTSSPLSFIGTNSFQSGKVAAELLHYTAGIEGKFAILHFDEERGNSPHMLEKELGFFDYIQTNCPGRECVTTVLNNNRQRYQGELETLFKNENIVGIFVSTSKTYRVGNFIRNMNIKNVILIGYDLVHHNIKLLKEGYIDFLINQNPDLQAEKSIETFCNYLIHGEQIDPFQLFPIEIITRTNLESYLKD